MTPLRRRMLEELQRRNYASETIRSYILSVKQFAEYFGKSPEKMGAEDIRRFQLYLLQEKKLAPGTVEMRMSALRFLYKKVLKRRDLAYDDLIFPKTPRKLPVVLSQPEVKRLIEAAPNLLYRTVLMVLYSTGVRRTEASLLKVSDIDSERRVIHVRQGKGSRDRISDTATLGGGRCHPQNRKQVPGTLSPVADVGAGQSAHGHRALPYGGTGRAPRPMPGLRLSGHLVQFVPEPALSEVSDQCAGKVAAPAATGTPAGGLLSLGL